MRFGASDRTGSWTLFGIPPAEEAPLPTPRAPSGFDTARGTRR